MKNFYWGGKGMPLGKAIYHPFCLRFLVWWVLGDSGCLKCLLEHSEITYFKKAYPDR